MKRVLIITGLAILFMCIFLTCEEAAPGIGPLYTIEVTPAAVNIEIDSTHQFSAIGRDADMNVIEGLAYTWTSRYPEVGTIDQNGLFTAITSGTTFLTAKSGTVESAQVLVTVYDPVFSIEIEQTSLTVYVDSTAQFTAVGKDMNGNDISGLSFTWEIGNNSIATIDNEGVVTGVTPGNTTVTAKLREVESLPAGVQVIEGTTGTVTDIDGNVYQTIKIGDQWWTTENLKVTHYRNGESIQYVQSETSEPDVWENLTTGAYGYYDDNESHQNTYGNLYNWYAVNDSRNIAPEGWHVPTDAEWKELEMYLGMSQSEADAAGYRGTNEGSKLAGNAGLWADGALENDSEFATSGFTALPGGYRYYSNGSYYDMGYYAYFWSATENNSYDAWHRKLYYSNSVVYRYYYYQRNGFSVRLLRD